MDKRIERDSLGEVAVPAQHLWGAQTQRSLANFAIGNQKFPIEFIHQYAILKKAAAITNAELHKLDGDFSNYIVNACDEIIAGTHDNEFPLVIWQTGSGTQTNMNLNEVIAFRANQIAGTLEQQDRKIHPNDHVNLSQSSNDTFPTAMHMTVLHELQNQLLPAVRDLIEILEQKQEEFASHVKSGRTHLMDATPVTLGQEFSGYCQQIQYAEQRLQAVQEPLQRLAIGASAVGTGLNTHAQWSEKVCQKISQLTGIIYKPAANKFMALAGHEALADYHHQLVLLATSLMKMANDLRWMASGPRCGLGEIQLPANEPGSSIMPGKVNPTQIEAMTMVCVRVMANGSAMDIANSQGQFELNVYKPLILYTALESTGLLSDAIQSFNSNCLRGIQADADRLRSVMKQSLMLVTALTPYIGYDLAAKAAKFAVDQNCSLRDAVLTLQIMSGEEFDQKVDPHQMLGPSI